MTRPAVSVMKDRAPRQPLTVTAFYFVGAFGHFHCLDLFVSRCGKRISGRFGEDTPGWGCQAPHLWTS